jgi:cytidylate kinase
MEQMLQKRIVFRSYKNVSRVSAVSAVRSAMVNLQRKMGENGGVVMDGRDIGHSCFSKWRM